MDIVCNKENNMVESFRWIGRDGNSYDPKEMETRHIFFSLRMIWNHTAPKEYKIEPYIRYKLGPRFTIQYITTAIRSLLTELQTRSDLTPYFKKCIVIMCKQQKRVE